MSGLESGRFEEEPFLKGFTPVSPVGETDPKIQGDTVETPTQKYIRTGIDEEQQAEG